MVRPLAPGHTPAEQQKQNLAQVWRQAFACALPYVVSLKLLPAYRAETSPWSPSAPTVHFLSCQLPVATPASALAYYCGSLPGHSVLGQSYI